MSDLCLPLGINKHELDQLESLVQSSPTFQASQKIFSQSESFEKIYAVKAGCVKTVHLDEAGHEAIVGFHLPGDLVGMDGIYLGQYTSSSYAIDTTVMCEIDYRDLGELCQQIPSIQTNMFKLLSRELYHSQVDRPDANDKSAEQRVAGFLHNLSARFHARGYSETCFPLNMSRQDIASFLGVTPETVSRIIKRFKENGMLKIEHKKVELLDLPQLAEIIDCKAA
ncbi:MAG: helix-turn-helix domain-containing protein [Pseudomonadota bacterium]